MPGTDDIELSTLGRVLHGLASSYAEPQDSVKSRIVATPPSTPAAGDRYIVPAFATGVWSGRATQIALFDAGVWQFITPGEGTSAWVDDEDKQITFDGSAWVTTSGTIVVSTLANKHMPALATTADGDLACAVAVQQQPITGCYPLVRINGLGETGLGDGTKVGATAYFSGDNGVTARALNAIAAGDKLYWNGSAAGWQLATTDYIDFDYQVTTLQTSVASLESDGQHGVRGGGTLHAVATVSLGGFLSAADKSKLDTLSSALVTTTSAGLMAATDKVKLDAVASGGGSDGGNPFLILPASPDSWNFDARLATDPDLANNGWTVRISGSPFTVVPRNGPYTPYATAPAGKYNSSLIGGKLYFQCESSVYISKATASTQYTYATHAAAWVRAQTNYGVLSVVSQTQNFDGTGDKSFYCGQDTTAGGNLIEAWHVGPSTYNSYGTNSYGTYIGLDSLLTYLNYQSSTYIQVRFVAPHVLYDLYDGTVRATSTLTGVAYAGMVVAMPGRGGFIDFMRRLPFQTWP